MPQDVVIMNGGESPLSPQGQSGESTGDQPQAGASHMDGGPAPGGVGEAQEPAAGLSAESAGVANSGGIMRPM